ncbi:MAG: glycerol-3-phosphate dehydrogenase/oxidase [Thermoguttaceae bacterium]|jgi:glycerol-3-phosphate dehydrogenase
MNDRNKIIEQLTGAELDVLVAGGGIVGAGVARDAAMRGLRVGLVEQHDLAFGTSSRSTRLLHGGLRYLAQGHIGLVYQSSHEKKIVHRIAPHISRPLPIIFPTYRLTQWPFWKLRIGVKIYDLLCGGRNLGPSYGLSAGETLARVPGLNPYDLTGAVRYFDSQSNDARLVIDTLRSAAGHGAIVANYLRLETALAGKNRWECQLRDTFADQTHRIFARTVVNACGPWSATLPNSSVRLRLTKGVHLVIDRRRLNVPDAVMVTKGERTLFVIPWGERCILGSTDTDYDGPLDDVHTETDDVRYVLEVINHYFPDAKIIPSDILSTWAGLRPLIATGKGGPSDISRAHQIRMPKPGWIDVAGGKLTTYRLIGEQVVDRVVQHLGKKTPPCRTAEEPLCENLEILPSPFGRGAGGESEAQHDARIESGVLPPPVFREVVEHYCLNEWAVHLDDVMIRRTSWHYYLDNPLETAQQVAAWMAEICAWDAQRQETELTRYRRQVEIDTACKNIA